MDQDDSAGRLLFLNRYRATPPTRVELAFGVALIDRCTKAAFRYGMRNTALDETARAQRAAYLNENGWVASTVRMGNDGRSQEMQIAFTRFALPFSLALGRWLLATNSSEWWPSTITDHEGCFIQQLVRGSVPQGLRFKTPFWITTENK